MMAPRHLRVTMMMVISQAEERAGHGDGDEAAERDGRSAAADDDAAVDEADEQDEEADADDDRLLQLDGDGLEDGLTEAGEHEDRDGDALEHDEAHGLGNVSPWASDEAERHDRVEAHAGGDGVGAVGDQAHEDGHDAGHEAGRRQHRGERQTLAAEAEDVRVHEDDVGHDDEGREPCQRVALERRVPLLELEEPLERAARAGFYRFHKDLVLLSGSWRGGLTARAYPTTLLRAPSLAGRP